MNQYGIRSATSLENFVKQPVYNTKYLNTKLKFYNGKIYTDFNDKKETKKKLSLFLFNRNNT